MKAFATVSCHLPENQDSMTKTFDIIKCWHPIYNLIFSTIESPESIIIFEEQDNQLNFDPNVLLTLTCKASDAKPPANIIWKIDNKNFSSIYPGMYCRA